MQGDLHEMRVIKCQSHLVTPLHPHRAKKTGSKAQQQAPGMHFVAESRQTHDLQRPGPDTPISLRYARSRWAALHEYYNIYNYYNIHNSAGMERS